MQVVDYPRSCLFSDHRIIAGLQAKEIPEQIQRELCSYLVPLGFFMHILKKLRPSVETGTIWTKCPNGNLLQSCLRPIRRSSTALGSPDRMRSIIVAHLSAPCLLLMFANVDVLTATDRTLMIPFGVISLDVRSRRGYLYCMKHCNVVATR